MILFAYPYLFMLIVLPVMCYFLLPVVKNGLGDALKVPFIEDLKNIKNRTKDRFLPNIGKNVLISLRFLYLFLIYLLLVVAIARPQFVGEPFRLKANNRDIMLVIDISTSMLNDDFSTFNRKIDRLSAVKYVVGEFLKKRTEDRVGLI